MNPPEPARRWPALLRAYPYTAVAVVFFAAMAVPFCTRKPADWDNVYVPAAARLARGEDIYQGGFVYPPVNAWLGLPFRNLPKLPSRLVWLLLNAGAATVVVGGAWRLAGGGRLQGAPPTPRREHHIFALGMACALPFVLDALTNQQSDLLVAALVVGGCCACADRRDWRAGLLFGLAAGIKCTPLLWAPYLAWRRRWVAAALVPLVAVGVNLLPDVTHPTAAPGTRAGEWANRYLLPMAAGKHDLGTWAAAITSNHSLAGAANRMLTWDYGWERGRIAGFPRAERVAPETLKAVALGAMLAFVVAALACSRRRRDDGALVAAPTPSALEFGLVLTLMLLLSPQSSKPHFCTLVLPGFCLARAALEWRDRRLLAVLVGAVACAVVSNRDLVGGAVYDWVLWHGSVTLSAVLVHAGACLALRVRPRAAVAVPAADAPARIAA